MFDWSIGVQQANSKNLVAKTASAVCLIIALIVLVGWTFDVDVLVSIAPSWPRMVPLSALGIVMMSAAVVLQTSGSAARFWISIGFAALSLALGLAAGIMRYFEQGIWGLVIALPGQEPLLAIPSTLTCIGLIMTSSSMLMIASRKLAGFGQAIALVTLLFALLTGLGFLAQETFLYTFLPGQGTSLPTVTGFVLLSAGLLFLRPDLGIMVAVSSDTVHARTSRQLLISSVAIPILLGVAVALGIQVGLYNVETAILLLVWGLVVLLGILIWRYALELYHVDAKRNRAEHDLRFLANASAELAGLVEPQDTLDRLASLAVPRFADWCTIDILQEDGSLKRMAVAHTDPDKVRMAQDLQRRFPPDPAQPQGAWNVIRTGQSRLIHKITDKLLEQAVTNPEYRSALKEMGICSYMGVPLSAHGKTLGVVGFVSAESGRLYGEEDLALAEDLARRTAVAMENANLYRMVQESDHAKDIFLATLAHELRNPLAAIAGGIDMLRLTSGKADNIEKYVHLIGRQTDHLSRLVDDLADISRITTGKIELKKEPVSLSEIIGSAIEVSRAEVEAGNHQLTVTMPQEETGIFADPVRLTQVFSNLLTNAARYTDPGGRIHIALECLPDQYIVRVRDNGIGIAADKLKDIFKMFSQVTHPIQRPKAGLGIGLSLVEGLVQLHHGHVQAISEGLEKGSEFVVHLPREVSRSLASPLSSAPLRKASSEKVRKHRILVVDDNVDAAISVTDILETMGHEVSMVHDGNSALAAIAQTQPEFVLLDIGLPDMDGYEVARRIRSGDYDSRIKLIAVTGWGQSQDKQCAFDAGFNQHWVKPVRLDQIKRMFTAEQEE